MPIKYTEGKEYVLLMRLFPTLECDYKSLECSDPRMHIVTHTNELGILPY